MSGRGGLTVGQDRFVVEYLKDHNGSAAYRRAYPKAKSEAVSRAAAARLLANVSVRAAVEAAVGEQQERVKLEADDVLRGLKSEAEYRGEGTSHSARVAAWVALGKHLGMFKDTVSLEGPAFKIYAGFDPNAV